MNKMHLIAMAMALGVGQAITDEPETQVNYTPRKPKHKPAQSKPLPDKREVPKMQSASLKNMLADRGRK